MKINPENLFGKSKTFRQPITYMSISNPYPKVGNYLDSSWTHQKEEGLYETTLNYGETVFPVLLPVLRVIEYPPEYSESSLIGAPESWANSYSVTVKGETTFPVFLPSWHRFHREEDPQSQDQSDESGYGSSVSHRNTVKSGIDIPWDIFERLP